MTTLSNSLLHPTSLLTKKKKKKKNIPGNGFVKMLKLLPSLAHGWKTVAVMMAFPRRPLLTDGATIVTFFGYSRRRAGLVVQENPNGPPIFLIELPLPTETLHQELDGDAVRITLESRTRSQHHRLMDEMVWLLVCNGRKVGYAIRRRNMIEDEEYVMRTLRGVSTGAGILQGDTKGRTHDGALTYIRARFNRVGSKDAVTLHLIHPQGHDQGSIDLSIFFMRGS